MIGVVTPSDFLGAVNEGIDMFDCVMPTRSGRTGLAFTWEGKLNLKNSKFKNDTSPLDKNCDIRGVNKYSKSYLHHLIKSREILGASLLTWHNLQFYMDLVKNARKSILEKKFANFEKNFLKKYKSNNHI